MYPVLLLFLFLISFQQEPQESLNKAYVDEVGENMGLLLSSRYEEGMLFMQDDTLKMEVLVFRRKERMNAYLFCVGRFSADSVRIYTTDEIDGYQVDGKSYIKHSIDGEQFFVQQVKAGKVDLYERTGIPSDKRFLYYVKLSYMETYHVICPGENNIVEHKMSQQSSPSNLAGGASYFSNKGIPQKFKLYISTYLGDCERVVNLVNSDFYSVHDLPQIIGSYNKCFEK